MTTVNNIDGRRVYTSKVPVPKVPEVSVYDFVLGDTSFDDERLAFHEISKRNRKIT